MRKITKYDEKPNKTWSLSTNLIIIKTKGFRSVENVCLGLLNWSFGFQPKTSFVFSTSIASRRTWGKKVYLNQFPNGDLFWKE